MLTKLVPGASGTDNLFNSIKAKAIHYWFPDGG
jgi:hypothetical protein